MSKIKKVLALVLAMAMVMAMSIVSFAANGKATITVSGLASTGTNTVRYVKILEPDVTVTESGYRFTWAEGVSPGTSAKAFLYSSVADQKTALNSATLPAGTETTLLEGTTTFTADVEAGYYAVFVTNNAADGDPAIVYSNPMIVSVEYKNATLKSDGSYEYDAVADTNSSVVAKYSTIPVVKEAADTDKVVAIGTTQRYTIETYIPSEVSTFTLTDVLTGATYKTGTEVVTIEGVEGNLATSTVSYNEAGNMVITLTNYLANAGKKVTVTYDVTVTETKVNNTVTPNDGKHTFTPDGETLYTGAITLTKVDANDDTKKLSGAVFNVKDEKGNVLKFTFNNTDNMYHLDPENGDVAVTTGTAGTLTVIGLDLGTYYFEEVQAPEGYSINTTAVNATITNANTTASTTLDPATTTMQDTTLSPLPSTGGIGTTIFTVVGCLIMIAAAAMFFVSRRRTEK